MDIKALIYFACSLVSTLAVSMNRDCSGNVAYRSESNLSLNKSFLYTKQNSHIRAPLNFVNG